MNPCPYAVYWRYRGNDRVMIAKFYQLDLAADFAAMHARYRHYNGFGPGSVTVVYSRGVIRKIKVAER